MSAEVVKKRGRPKKVVSESTPVESLESVKKGTRQKSTKASAPASAIAPKSAKPLVAHPEDSSITSAAVQKKTGKTKTSSIAANTPCSSPIATPPEATSETPPIPPKSSATSSTPKVTPANSKILSQVRALSSKAASAAKSSPAASKPPNPIPSASPKATRSPSHTSTPKPSASLPQLKSSLPDLKQEPLVSSESSVVNTSSSQLPPTPSSTQPQTQQSQRSIPISSLNSSIVSQISSRAGARPGRPPTDLPANYKTAARRITMTIVALPIAVVTSWVLYERREDRKQLVRPGMVMVEESPRRSEEGGIVSEKDT